MCAPTDHLQRALPACGRAVARRPWPSVAPSAPRALRPQASGCRRTIGTVRGERRLRAGGHRRLPAARSPAAARRSSTRHRSRSARRTAASTSRRLQRVPERARRQAHRDRRRPLALFRGLDPVRAAVARAPGRRAPGIASRPSKCRQLVLHSEPVEACRGRALRTGRRPQRRSDRVRLEPRPGNAIPCRARLRRRAAGARMTLALSQEFWIRTYVRLRCRASHEGRDMRTTTTASGRGRDRPGHPDRRAGRRPVVGPGPARRAPDRRVADARRAHRTRPAAPDPQGPPARRPRRRRAPPRFSPRALPAPRRRRAARRLARRVRELRRELKRRAAGAPPPRRARRSASPTLEAIAACESGGNPATDTGNGFYGKYQFTLQTWQSVGGSGNPAAASEAEQNRRAAHALRARGRLALARLRSLVVSEKWPSATSFRSSSGSPT